MSGQVIVVSGTSGAGKTTTCRAFANRSDEVYFLFGFDMLVSSLIASQFTTYGSRAKDYYYNIDDRDVAPGQPRMGFGAPGWRALGAFHEMIAAAARSGQSVIVDHLMFVDPPILQDCIWRLKDVSVLFVVLRPPYEVLRDRILNRKFPIPPAIHEVLGSNAAKRIADGLEVMMPWLYEGAYKNDCCDLMIDSSACVPEQVCELIEQRLSQGPGTAFDELRQRYPRSLAEPNPV